jgi:hypothetical protein
MEGKAKPPCRKIGMAVELETSVRGRLQKVT